MYMKHKIVALIVMLCCGGTPMLNALTKKQVAFRTVAAATLAGAATYYCFLPDRDNSWFPKWQWPWGKEGEGLQLNPDVKTSIIGGLAAGASVGGLVGYIAAHYTPHARYVWINTQFEKLEHGYLYNTEITSSNLKTVLEKSGCEATGLPLVTAFLELQSYDRHLVYMDNEIEKGIADAGHSSLGAKLHEQRTIVRKKLEMIRHGEALLKNNDPKAWLDQWKIYQTNEIERQKLALECQKLAATQLLLHNHVIYTIHRR